MSVKSGEIFVTSEDGLIIQGEIFFTAGDIIANSEEFFVTSEEIITILSNIRYLNDIWIYIRYFKYSLPEKKYS